MAKQIHLTNSLNLVNVMLIALPSGDYTDMNTRQMTRGRGKPKLDSGNYRHGFAVTERKKIDPGAYTLVVSTFNQGQVGAFSVKVSSSVKTRFDAIL